LRAVAVGLVILNHMWPGDLPGGYIGVDIFFVISGFLITSHLQREVDATGTVRLARFWARRAKRLLPAAILVLAASTAITYWLLPVTSARSVLGEIAAAGAYVLNWVLAADSLDYFAHDVISPVTHYWSLSVEEQFYIVWPVLILLAIVVGRRLTSTFRKRVMLGALGLVFAGSLGWAVWSVAVEPNAAYFQTTGRAWEFAAGGLLAFLPAARGRASVFRAIVSWGLWAVIATCGLAYGPESGFPSVAALIPVAATVALIWVGNRGARLSPQRVLAFRPIQFVGDISYSLYLWHWPLIVAAVAVLGDLSGVAKAALLAVTVVLAWLTKKYVEDTVRSARGPVFERPWRVLVATAATIALIFVGTSGAAAMITSRAESAAQKLYEASRVPALCFGAQAAFNEGCGETHTLDDPDYTLVDWGLQNTSVSNGTFCQQQRGVADILTCSFGVPEGQQHVNVALVGDSHATVLATALDAIAERDSMRVTTYLNSGCAALDDPSIVFRFDSNASHIGACKQWRERVISRLADSEDIDVIVTTSVDRFYGQESDPSVRDTGDGYVRAWNRWLEAGKTVIVINAVPVFRDDVPACLATSHAESDPCAMEIDPNTRYGPLAVAASQIDDPHLHLVDHWDVFCSGTTCSPAVGGIPAYIDVEHLTASFARSFADDLIPAGLIAPRAE
jgi:peptidoglycan/LPS O-acetylase OafA/YrhL